MEAFAQFSSELDQATQRQLARGARVVEVLKQPQYDPKLVEEQIVIIYAVTNGWLDDVEVADIREWETDYVDFLKARHPEVLSRIRTHRNLDDELKSELDRSLEQFKSLR